MTHSVKRIKKDENQEISSTRTLCIGNISSIEEQQSIKDYLNSLENVFEIYTLNDQIYSVLFVIFYNYKTCEEVFDHFTAQDKVVLYTVSKYEIPRTPDKCDESKNQGTILVMGRDLTEPLAEEDLITLFQTYGKIRCIRDYKPYQKYIEFEDTRHAINAFNSIDGTKYKSGSLLLKFSWDIPVNKRWEMIKEIDTVLKEVASKKENIEMSPVEKTNKIYEKNIFLKVLDDFIVENLDSIEKWF